MTSSERKIIRVRDVMKKDFDMIDGRMTVMDALRTMKHVENKSLIVDKTLLIIIITITTKSTSMIECSIFAIRGK